MHDSMCCVRKNALNWDAFIAICSRHAWRNTTWFCNCVLSHTFHMTLHSIVPRNSVQRPKTLFPCAGDEIHPVLWNRGLVYETIVCSCKCCDMGSSHLLPCPLLTGNLIIHWKCMLISDSPFQYTIKCGYRST